MIILNIFIILIFISLSLIYMYFTLSKGTEIFIPEENIIVCIFAVYFVCMCFIYSNLGFISLLAVNNVVNTYLILGYAGIKTNLRYLFNKDNKNTFINNLRSYCITTALFIIIILICNFIAIQDKSNFFIMLPKLLLPFYTFYLLFQTLRIPNNYKEINNAFSISLLNLNYYTFFISLYELGDWFIYITNMKYYNTWEGYYNDPTHIFDIFWIVIISILWVFIPRIIYLKKK